MTGDAAARTSPIRHLDGIRSLADRFDGFVVDLWGVVHDGERPYPGAADALTRLRAAEKRVVLLSNAPQRRERVLLRLREMGIGDALHDGLVTSGEETRRLLAEWRDPFLTGLARRVLMLGPERDRPLVDGIGLQLVEKASEAALLLNVGPDHEAAETDLEPYLPLLRASLEAGLPMLCANPDLEIVRDGRRIACAGLLARSYAEMGGAVRQVGKPFPEIYRPVKELLGLPDGRILAIGDALATDIAGAAAAGIASCWALGGIHADALRGDPALAARAAMAAQLQPFATVPSLRW
ncbi:TIGR01459 family HAD-type hydrolase [Rhizosaccharibacter radicis]|uniref:TIGR01459 family HAD-type hydrolase n=1 Tax=Rhizosaccharibacter radicis TaxID=2782605 RepID=A0ABT1W023_9PROT|nr:TIGR01459 family HAD-type hydrolase [Acetobacteraceae bacterium KSS12]